MAEELDERHRLAERSWEQARQPALTGNKPGRGGTFPPAASVVRQVRRPPASGCPSCWPPTPASPSGPLEGPGLDLRASAPPIGARAFEKVQKAMLASAADDLGGRTLAAA